MAVSRIALGSTSLSGTSTPEGFDEAKAAHGVAAIEAALAAGITFFDFADIYAGGTSELVWKYALESVPELRHRGVVCTKAGIRLPREGSPYHYDNSASHLQAALEGSLRRLGVDRIDLFLLHRHDPLTHPRETASALQALMRSGMVGSIGVSNYTASQVRALSVFMDEPLAASQPSFSPWDIRAMEDGTLDVCEELGLLAMVYSPLAGGLLAGRRQPSADDDERQERLRGLRAALGRCAETYNCTANQIALAWLLAHPANVAPIVGSQDPAHIREAAGACQVQLSREDWYRLWVAARGAGIP